MIHSRLVNVVIFTIYNKIQILTASILFLVTSSVVREDRGAMSDWDVKFYPGRSTLHRKPLGEANYSPSKRQPTHHNPNNMTHHKTNSQRNINFNNATQSFNLYGTQV